MDVCFTSTDVTPAPGDSEKPTTKSSTASMGRSNPFERKPAIDLQIIRSQTKWHSRVKTVPSIPSKGPVVFMPEDILQENLNESGSVV